MHFFQAVALGRFLCKEQIKIWSQCTFNPVHFAQICLWSVACVRDKRPGLYIAVIGEYSQRSIDSWTHLSSVRRAVAFSSDSCICRRRDRDLWEYENANECMSTVNNNATKNNAGFINEWKAAKNVAAQDRRNLFIVVLQSRCPASTVSCFCILFIPWLCHQMKKMSF